MGEVISNKMMPLDLFYYTAVSSVRSIRRAIKRGRVTPRGMMIPDRPFNNRGNTSVRNTHSRSFNEEKKKIYARLSDYRRQFR